MSSKNSELWRQARRARDTLVARLSDHPEVSLIDIGYDPEPGPAQDPDSVVIRVHLRQPDAAQGLDLPQEMEGIPVRVMEGDYEPEQEADPPAPQAAPRQAREKTRGGRSRSAPARAPEGAEQPATPAPPADPGWQGLADFALSIGFVSEDDGEPRLETRARHLQADQAMRWPGLALDQLAVWMMTQASMAAPRSAADQAAAPVSSPTTEPGETAVVELSGLWVSEVRAPEIPGQPGGATLRAEVCFSIVEPTPAIVSASLVPYTIEFSLLNLETDELNPVAAYNGWLRPGEMDCPIEQDFPAPSLGRYQLSLVARLLPPGEGSHSLAGPTIVVEE